MKKSTLIVIADILNTIERSNRNIYESIELLNLTPEEQQKVIDSIMVVVEKLEQMRRSNINNLDEYIDINLVESINRF